jgi:osmotically-inducible protein OsmY
MKNILKVSHLIIGLSAGALALGVTSGCAGTATKESTGEMVDNSAITTKVKAAFVKDEIVKATEVKVETFKGVVQLSGFVSTQEQKARAETIASGIAGVTSVKNDIIVK